MKSKKQFKFEMLLVIMILFGFNAASNAQSKTISAKSGESIQNASAPVQRHETASKASIAKPTENSETQLPRAVVSANRKADIANYQLAINNWMQNKTNASKLTKLENELYTNGNFEKLYENAVNAGNIIYATEKLNTTNHE